VETFDLIGLALQEDLGSGDVTSSFFIPAGDRARASILAKEPGTAAGVEVAAEVFSRVDSELSVRLLAGSGTGVAPGDSVLEVAGATRSILAGERLALNFIQRLSGIATATRRYVDAVRGTKAKILDTRKTTPGLRAFEKAAVVAGGGNNHRFGLHDMILVKDNHLAAAGGTHHLGGAIRKAKAERPEIRIEVEADTLDQVRAFLAVGGIDVILLDNMTPGEMRQAVRMAAGRVLLEASGGVTLASVRTIAETGVDLISVGAITHSVRALDFSLELLGRDV
jgi:nicotinate-nucleotide pyrophosphorylase (carboxylating)